MSLQGSFSLYTSVRMPGFRLWQFVLKNTNMFLSETVEVMLSDQFGQERMLFRGVSVIKLKAGQSVAFNMDTVDWDWSQDDFAAIVNSSNKVLKKWQFHIKEYAPGECPECHGTHKCSACRGHSVFTPDLSRGGYFPPLSFEPSFCQRCGGRGICMTCNIERRKYRVPTGPTGLRPF